MLARSELKDKSKARRHVKSSITSEGKPSINAVLRQASISPTAPGTLLHDFGVMLKYVGEEGRKTSGKFGLLPGDSVPDLDRRLHRPLDLELDRPQIRSHPYIQALLLLLRASGLGQLRKEGKSSILFVDPPTHQVWITLNEVEQYFNLLEAWLFNGQDKMIGESCQGWQTMFSMALSKFQYLQRIQQLRMFNPIFFSRPDRFLFALMDFFGFVKVGFPRKMVQPWVPEMVAPTPMGAAVFELASNWLEEHPIPEPGEDFILGRWQALFHDYFPEWRNNLKLPALSRRTGAFIFKVYLGTIWRRIGIDASHSLDDLAHWILKSVNFDSDHLYEFSYRDRFGKAVKVCHPYMEEGPWTPEVDIGSLPIAPGQAIEFCFDFGEDWLFRVVLDRVESHKKYVKTPKILEKKGVAPAQYPSE